MGGIYSLNEQETTNFPPVVWVCIVVRCTTYYKRAYVECYKNIWISNVILYETLIVLLNNRQISSQIYDYGLRLVCPVPIVIWPISSDS